MRNETLETARPQLVFGEDGRVSGSTGLNRLFASFSFRDQEFELGQYDEMTGPLPRSWSRSLSLSRLLSASHDVQGKRRGTRAEIERPRPQVDRNRETEQGPETTAAEPNTRRVLTSRRYWIWSRYSEIPRPVFTEAAIRSFLADVSGMAFATVPQWNKASDFAFDADHFAAVQGHVGGHRAVEGLVSVDCESSETFVIRSSFPSRMTTPHSMRSVGVRWISETMMPSSGPKEQVSQRYERMFCQ